MQLTYTTPQRTWVQVRLDAGDSLGPLDGPALEYVPVSGQNPVYEAILARGLQVRSPLEDPVERGELRLTYTNPRRNLIQCKLGEGQWIGGDIHGPQELYVPVDGTSTVYETIKAMGLPINDPLEIASPPPPPVPQPPVNTGLPIVSGTPQVGSALTSTAGTWTNEPTDFQYTLMRDGQIAGPGGPTPVYTCTPEDQGRMLACRVRASNADGAAEATSEPVGPVEPEPVVPDPPPVNTALPVVSGTAQVGSSLSSTAGSWTNNPADYQYQWVRLPLELEAGVRDDIPGATNPTYLCQAPDAGRHILCRVTASNSEGEASAESLPYGPVRNPDWNPPAWMIRDTAIHEYDPIRPRPAPNVPTADPVFHTLVTRVTGNVGSAIGAGITGNWGSVVRHPHFTRQAWNCDQSLIYIIENSGDGAAGAAALFLNGETPYLPAFGRPSNWPAGADVIWHPTDPNLMDCARTNIYSHLNVRTGEETVIRTFAGLTDLRIGHNQGSRSNDNRTIVFTALRGGSETRRAFAYEIDTDTVHPEVVATSIVGGPTPTFTHARGSACGRYIIWTFSGAAVFTTDLEGNTLHTFIPQQVALQDALVLPSGRSAIVGRVDSSAAGVGPGGTQSAWDLLDGTRTQLTTSPYLYFASARAANINLSGHARWTLSDSRAIRGGGDAISNPPYTCELVLLPLEGGLPWRVCHHYNATTQDNPAWTGGSLSPDGQRAIFCSVWVPDGSLGANPRPVATFVADYRSATQPPDGVPPTNTVRPQITGTPQVGSQLICNNGTWQNGSWFARRWRRDGDPIIGATAAAYTPQEIDVDHMLDCQVICVSTTGGYTVADAAPVGPITRPGGGGSGEWEPPSWVIWDRVTRDFNPARAKIGYLVPTPDPNFGGLVTRVTGDPGGTIPNIGGTWGNIGGPNYINHQVWNADGSLMYVMNSGGTSGTIWLDGETYQPRYARGSNWPSGADVRWHMTDPALMNYASSSNFGTYNPATNTRTVIRDFGAAYSDMRIGYNKGNVSLDGKRVVLTATRGGRLTVIVYDIEGNTIISELDPTVVAPGRSHSSCWSSPSGNYIIWNFSPDNYLITDLEGAQVWDFPTNYISHGDCAFDDVGDEVLCGRKNSSTLPGWLPNTPGGEIWKHRLRDGMRTRLTEGGYCPHTADRQRIPRNNNFCVAATGDYRVGGNTPQHPPYIGEIIMPTLDGGRVYRLCQHYGSNGPEYETYAFAVQSPDSSRVCYRSDWRVGGTTPRPVQGYVVDIRGDG